MEYLQHPLMQGALAGFITAVLIDIAAFRAWQKWQDVLVYDWGVASFRWFQGAVVGLVTAAGLGAL